MDQEQLLATTGRRWREDRQKESSGRERSRSYYLREIVLLMTRILAAVSFSLILIAYTIAGSRAAPLDSPSRFDEFVALLTFIGGGSPLTEFEREGVKTELESQMRSDPTALARSEAKVQKILAAIPRAEAWERASQRESLRFQIELLPATDPTRQIVERHDPTVVFDRTNKRLVTEATLIAWQRACLWMTSYLSVPAPDPDFIAMQRSNLKAHFGSLSTGEQEAIAHVERDFPVGVLLLDRADADKREAFVHEARAQALDRQKLGVRVADAMAKAYDVALQREIIDAGIVLNAGFNLQRSLSRHVHAHLIQTTPLTFALTQSARRTGPRLERLLPMTP